ncbi:MAG: DinB family protein [Bryobacteraceae bacterium]
MKTLMGGAQALQAQVAGVIVKSAEKMPEENFAFKPTPDVRSFGAILGHIADAQYTFCSAVSGEKNPALGIEKSKTSKADLTQALKDAFAFCQKAYAISDSDAGGTVKFFGGERTKLNVLSFNTSHNFEHYGNLVTYMRMKGLVPPSSERR